MDVSATGQAAAAAVPQANVDVLTGVTAQGNASTSTPVASVDASQDASTQTTPTQPAAHNHSALAPAIAKLFSLPSPPEPIRLDVSYRVERDPNVIVTVFSDPQTGQEVAQFPPEVLATVAQFFDQQHGATLDQSA